MKNKNKTILPIHHWKGSINIGWQSEEDLQRTNGENVLSFLDSANVSDLIKNVEVWNDIFTSHHKRSLIERELVKLGITL